MTPNIVCVRGRYKSVWTRKNFGLRLVPAYALTVHKTQALSIKHLVLGCVALSHRARTLRRTVGRERESTDSHAIVCSCTCSCLFPWFSTAIHKLLCRGLEGCFAQGHVYVLISRRRGRHFFVRDHREWTARGTHHTPNISAPSLFFLRWRRAIFKPCVVSFVLSMCNLIGISENTTCRMLRNSNLRLRTG